MQAQSFEHKGVTFELEPVTDFQKSLAFLAMSDLCQAAFGTEWDDTPHTRRRLVDYFISWNINTTIDGQRWLIGRDDTPENYEAFTEAILGDNELSSKWLAAYKRANMETPDPNAQSAEPA